MDVINPSTIPWERLGFQIIFFPHLIHKESFSKDRSQREKLKISQLHSQQKDAKWQIHIRLCEEIARSILDLKHKIISKFYLSYRVFIYYPQLISLSLKDKSTKTLKI